METSKGEHLVMAQGRYLDVSLLSRFLFESITQGFQYWQISQVSLFTYGSSMATPAYAQLTHGLRVPYAKKHYHFNEGRPEKKHAFRSFAEHY